jgi:aminomethyltransferase
MSEDEGGATQGSVKSVWHDVQAEQGAEFEDFDGWLWTSTLGDPLAEYRAIRNDVALWDVYPLVKWDFSGPDALRAVQRVFTNDVTTMSAGAVRYGAFVDEGGRMVDDGTVYKLADDHCWVMTNTPGYEEYFGAAASGMDVSIEDRTHRMPLMSVQGPRSRDVLQGLTDADLADLRYFRFWPEPVQVAGVPAWVLRTGFSGELGFELIPDRDRAVELWRAVQDAGVPIFGTQAVEIARIESGMVVYGVDYEAGARTPYDIGFDRLVALDGELAFLGRDALREIAADPPNRFVTIRIRGTGVPEYGADVTKDGEAIGTLTSPTSSPLFGVIGLAVIRADHAADGTEVEVALEDGTATGTVAGPSLYDPEKRRPRS